MDVLTANALWIAIAALVLALVFLGLWLRARSGGGDSETKKQLRAAQNQVQLLKGDAIQANRDHAAEIGKLNKELETLRAVAGGKVPPELEQWKRRAQEAETKVEAERERHRAEVEKVIAAFDAGGGSADATQILSGGARDRVETLEKELSEAREQLENALRKYDADLAALTERLNSEKAAALTAQARRHAQEMEAARAGRPAPALSPDATLAEATLPGDSSVPDSARFPFLSGLEGAGQGLRFHLPYDMATIGRSDTNTVVLQEGMASRIHAEIRFDGRDFKLADRNSTNGTLLNGELVSAADLNFGDVIGIGETRLRFTCEAAEAAATDPASAEVAYEAMIRLAPTCRPALKGLQELLERHPERSDEVQAIRARLEQLEAGAAPAAG
jgi:FHA domain